MIAMNSIRNETVLENGFFGCRMCRSVALATFLAIILVEIIILIPSYSNFSRDWQRDREEVALVATRFALFSLKEDTSASYDAVANALNTLVTSDVILGWRIVDGPGDDRIRHFADRANDVLDNSLQGAGLVTEIEETKDVIWSGQTLLIPFDVEVRLDMRGLMRASIAFIWRIVGLVFVISIFVTMVTMYVLHRQVLRPILALRTYALKASGNAVHTRALVDNQSPNSEVGDVIDAFNGLLVRVGDHIQSAHYDELTRLPNRSLGSDRLRQALSYAARHHRSGAVMFIDIDNFKEINDTMGHGMGDELLKHTAERLSGVLRGTDSVARLTGAESANKTADNENMIARFGGDEFMVILPELASEEDASIVAGRLSEACAAPFQLHGRELLSTVSIGIAIFPRDGDNHQDLMMNADTALYSVKDSGRNNYRFYSAEMNSMLVDRLDIELQLRHALEKNELTLYYQPLVDIKTQKVMGVEALLRWQNECFGSIEPDRFIPIAESSGLIVPIGEWVLEQACLTATKLSRRGFPMRMAVNVSTRQFRDKGFVDVVSSVLSRSLLPASELELEITESLLVDETCEPTEIINELRELGIRFSIDDFGTGYSSLSYLRRFDVNTLKIDRSFIAGVSDNEKDASLARTIIDMAKNFGLEIIAEGVEDQTQLDFLMRHDCDIAQGYYLGRPMPYDDLLEVLMTRDKN